MANNQEPVCVTCEMPLVVEIEAFSDDQGEGSAQGSNTETTQYVDDDVKLRCGCQFHWQCLLDNYAITECPHCKINLISTASNNNKEQILCRLKNEGGVQDEVDILPVLVEESFLKTYPEERKPRAFLEFCASGDTQAVIDMLDEDDEDEETEQGQSDGNAISQDQLLRYQDNLGSRNSALHLAIENDKEEIAWILLLLASCLDLSQFPSHVLAGAGEMGVVRNEQTAENDIRYLKNADGLTAEDMAKSRGGVWTEWIRRGLLG